MNFLKHLACKLRLLRSFFTQTIKTFDLYTQFLKSVSCSFYFVSTYPRPVQRRGFLDAN